MSLLDFKTCGKKSLVLSFHKMLKTVSTTEGSLSMCSGSYYKTQKPWMGWGGGGWMTVILRLLCQNDHWQTQERCWLAHIHSGKATARNRFSIIWCYLHLHANTKPNPNSDKCIKTSGSSTTQWEDARLSTLMVRKYFPPLPHVYFIFLRCITFYPQKQHRSIQIYFHSLSFCCCFLCLHVHV